MYQVVTSALIMVGCCLWLTRCGSASSGESARLAHPSSENPLVVVTLKADQRETISEYGLRSFESKLVAGLAKDKGWEVSWVEVSSIQEAESLVLKGGAHFFTTMGRLVDFSELIPTQSYRSSQFVESCRSEGHSLLGSCANACSWFDLDYVTEMRRFDPNFQVKSGPKPASVAWWLAPESELSDTLNEWISLRSSAVLKELDQRHMKGFKNFSAFETIKLRERYHSRLPSFRRYFELAAEETGYDWRWLAALSYQESHWNPKAVSPTGVRGLMMLTLATAREMGVFNREDPRESILGGARYLRHIEERLPDYIKPEDRWFFTLAAYNVGLAHLKDAMALTVVDNGNPGDWFEVMSHLPKLAQPRYFKTTRFGYARGKEPVTFVNRIQNYYDVLVFLESQQSLKISSLQPNE